MIEHFRIWFALRSEELNERTCCEDGWPAFWTSVTECVYRELEFIAQP